MKENILVTGGAGYIGSTACKALDRAGFNPVSLDNLCYGHRWAVKWGDLAVGDVRDKQALDQIFETYSPAAVMHFAALAYVGESVQDPEKYYDNNVAGTLNLLRAMRGHGCKNFIFSSSCAVYGDPLKLPLTEAHPKNPISPYGRTKLMVERMLADFDRAYGLAHVNLRYFNAAGADLDCEVGEAHQPETHLIPLALNAALGTGGELNIFGDDYPSRDGTAVRDYIHVQDLAEAHVKALSHLLQGGKSASLNLGSGRGHSVLEVVKTAEKVSGREVPRRTTHRRPGDPAELTADPALAAEVLGWECKIPDLEPIMRSAWDWLLKMEKSPELTTRPG